mmetsp:Transcript_8214/g.24712  ORF Transcript_8214/g.24712 Transcript_8214/m.24712 type:complete len:519 (+) Transcript_8214:181-1737(+)
MKRKGDELDRINAAESAIAFKDVDDTRWKIVKDGTGWRRAEVGDQLVVNCTGRTADEREVDRRENMHMKLGDSTVPALWNDALKMMAKGEVVSLNVPAKEVSWLNVNEKDINYELELVSWIPRRDLLNDGSAVESLIDEGEGWERPDKHSEVKAELWAVPVGKPEKMALKPTTRTFHLGSPSIPNVWNRSISGMRKNSLVSIRCDRQRTQEIGQYLAISFPDEINFFIKLLSWFKIEDMFGDTKAKKKVINEGLGWEKPGEGAEVTIDVNYRRPGTSEIIWSGEQKITVGDGMLCDAMDTACESMKRGEKAIVLSESSRAFLSCPELAPPGISPKDDIEVDIVMKDLVREPAIWTMSFDDAIEAMKRRREKGNNLFKKDRLAKALRHYERSFQAMDRCQPDLSAEKRATVDSLRTLCLVNMSFCYEKLGDFKEMYNYADRAVMIEPSNVKALYRRGTASMMLGNYGKAETDLRYASELTHGRDTDVKKRLREIQLHLAKQDAEERKKLSTSFREMFCK